MQHRPLSITITLAALALFSPSVAGATDASMFRADAAHTGVYPGAAPVISHVKWRFHSHGKIISSPTVAGGIVYVGSTDANIYAVRANDGSLVWKAATDGPVNSTPAVSDGRVYAASIDGYVYALDAASGKKAWRFKTGGERRFTAPGIHGLIPRTQLMADPSDVLMSSPGSRRRRRSTSAAATTTSMRSTRPPARCVGSSRPATSCTHPRQLPTEPCTSAAGTATCMRSTQRQGTSVGAFRPATTATSTTRSASRAPPPVVNGSVYFGCRDSHFYALDARTGHLRWKHDDHGSWVIGSPAVRDGIVYFTTSDERRFFALDTATGAVRFSLFSGAFSFSSPSLAGNIVYYGTFDGHLYGVDVRSGKVVERFATDGSRRSLSKYLDGHGDLDVGKLYPDLTFEGAIVGLNNIYALGSIVGSPAIDGGALFIGGTDGTLYALD